MKHNTEPIWEGTYNSFDEAPSHGKGFSDIIYINKCVKNFQNIENRDPLLAITISLLHKNKTHWYKTKILDFGGGLGLTYKHVRNSIHENFQLEYVVIDNSAICKRGKELFKSPSEISFLSKLPDSRFFNIIYFGSSIHYVEEWKNLLTKCGSYGSEYLVFHDVPTGEIPTFVTVQNFYNSKVPCRFFNYNEFVESITKIRYELIYREFIQPTILGVKQDLPMSNFDQQHQIKKSCNFIFSMDL